MTNEPDQALHIVLQRWEVWLVWFHYRWNHNWFPLLWRWSAHSLVRHPGRRWNANIRTWRCTSKVLAIDRCGAIQMHILVRHRHLHRSSLSVFNSKLKIATIRGPIVGSTWSAQLSVQLTRTLQNDHNHRNSRIFVHRLFTGLNC